MPNQPILLGQIQAWSEAYQHSTERRLATRALAASEMHQVMRVQSEADSLRHHFSVEVPTMEVTSQNNSGRCWIFAATNVLRERVAKEKNLEKFELSQSYLAFWDKFERCNYFLETMLETADLPTDDRTVSFVLQTGVHDGGQWDMFVNIVNKYGIVPKTVFDETYQSSHTQQLNHYLNRSLKAGAVKLRTMKAQGSTDEAIRQAKNELLGQVYGFLCSCYGEPPKTFAFEYVDQDKVYHREDGYTPITFRDKYVGDLLDRCVSIINAPTKDKPYNKIYTIKLLGNVVGGREVRHLNLDMATFKQAIIRQLQAGKIVWFGSDVGKFGDRERGYWDDKAFDAKLVTGLELDISKADSLDYGFAAMNHAMVLTGVNLVDGKPNRWKIENSWGNERGEKGYYLCSDTWFDQFVFQAAVEKEYLGDLANLTEQEAIVLDPWDPMGTLAE